MHVNASLIFIHSFYLTQIAWPKKNTKHRNTKLKQKIAAEYT